MIPPLDGNGCAFCDYLNGVRPYVFLWREPQVAVAVTREQRGVSHLLVFPTSHTPTLLDLESEVGLDLMLALRDAAVTIDRADGSPGVAVWQNNGAPAGQAIGHLHFHVAGTLPGGGTNFGDVEEISLQAAEEIAQHLRAHVPLGGGGAKRRLST